MIRPAQNTTMVCEAASRVLCSNFRILAVLGTIQKIVRKWNCVANRRIVPFWAQSFLLKPLNHSIYLPISAKTRLRSAPTRVDTAEVCDHFGRKRRIVTQYPAAGILNCDQNHLISRIVTQSPVTAHPNESNLRPQPDDKTRYLSRPHWERSSISGLLLFQIITFQCCTVLRIPQQRCLRYHTLELLKCWA